MWIHHGSTDIWRELKLEVVGSQLESDENYYPASATMANHALVKESSVAIAARMA
jgi:hypothetical protein